MSFVAALPTDERAGWLAQVTELVKGGETPAELPVHVVIGLTARSEAPEDALGA
jgi:hypothetical protein